MQPKENNHIHTKKPSQRLKILLVSNMYPSPQKKYSGIFVKNQYQELVRQSAGQEDISIFYMERSMTGALMSAVKYIRLFFKFIPYLFKKYQVVHLHYFVPLIVLVWAYKVLHPKTKLLVTFHGGDINTQVNSKNKWFYRPLAKKIDLAIPVGKHVAQNVVSKLGVTKHLVLPVGVDNRVFYPEPNTKKIYDFIFVGSFFHVKGIDIMYNAIQQSPKTVRFCVVGKGAAYEPKFQELIRQGYLIVMKIDQTHEQLRQLYNESRFLVLPSRSEGFPTVTVEAMYCATPVITSDIPQFKEQVVPGKNGFMFAKEQTNQLVELLEKTLKMPDSEYKFLSKNAQESFPELRLDRVCEQILNQYRC